MPSDFNHIRYNRIKFASKHSYAVLMKTINNALVLESSDAAAFRLHVLGVYYRHGWKAVISAFKISKSTLYNWRKAYQASQRKTVALVPESTRPKQVRSMQTHPKVVAFIVSMRNQYGNVSKYKIKKFLDEYTKELGIVTIGVTTIGKIIKRKQLFQRKKRRYVYRQYGSISRVKHAPKETHPGYIEMDSITLMVMGKRWCFMSVIDVVTKYAHCSVVTGLTTKEAVRVLKLFQQEYTLIRIVQTDNGSEFLGEFHASLETQSITHHFIYPQSPRINGVVERFNRTIQEECINRSDELFYDSAAFQEKLTNYLLWYNTKRPHHSLKLMSPTQYLKQLNTFPISR